MTTTASRPQQIARLKSAFFRAFRPPSPLEEIETYCRMALADLKNEKLSQAQRHNSALRLLACIPAISARLTTEGANEIFGKLGVTPPGD
jgi:hypothetical protein